jgi:hypothetical protein
MTVLVRRIRSTDGLLGLSDAGARLLISALFWLLTAVLATVLLIADPVSGTFVVGIPLLLVVFVRERGLDGIPAALFGASIGSSLAFTIFLGQQRAEFAEGVVIAAFVILLFWVSTYPIMLRQMDRQYLRERSPVVRSGRHRRSRTVTRLAVVWAWMVLLGGIAAYLAGGLLIT